MSDLKAQLQRTLGDAYTIEQELAGGGMSRVFVAQDRQLGRRVVVKTLADIGAPVSVERFRREIRVAASLQQANVVPVLSAGDVEGVPYYTMPFVEGQSLRARLAADGALTVRDAVHVLRDVARALAFAHERGVVHRDIKPENILLSGDTAVVTDFGIAKAIEASQSRAGAPTLTNLGVVIGTPAYMSPEQAAGEATIDHRADLYSLGVVGYELLSGSPPFPEQSAHALMAAHMATTPIPLGDRRRDLPPRLVALVMRCLEKDPARRPGSAAELLRALDVALAQDTASAMAGRPSIAVLPFANLSPDPADEFFADGLTDEIITDLSGIRALQVIARTAMMRYKGSGKVPAEVARELKVRYVLDGSLRRAGQSLRLTARLVDTADDTTLWSEKLSGVVDDIFDMQERVSRTIVEALALTLTPRESDHLASRQIADVKAYEAYLQARQSIWTFDPAALASALQLIEAARARIGENPRLLAAEALAHLNHIETGRDDARPHLEAVARCVERLAVVDPESYSRYAVAGQLAWREGHVREAIELLSRALDVEVGGADVAIYLAYAYLLAGQDTKAREVADRFLLIDPLTPLFQVMPGFCEFMAGRPEGAVPYYVRFAEAEPASPIAQYFLLAALAETDDAAGTLRAAEELARRFPATVFGTIGEIYSAVRRGRMAPSDVVITAEIRAHSARSEAFARPLSVLMARAGVADAAMDALEDAIGLGLAHYPYLARNSKAFNAVREHPRFRRILEKVRLRWERGGTSAEDLKAPQSAPMASAQTSPEKQSVAVLPFANLSPDPENEFFADGITDDLIAQVAKIGSLRVIARTSVMRYRGTRTPAALAARELGVTAVVEGTVRRAGNRARIVAQLVDASTEAPMWSETFDRDLDDVFSVQSEVAMNVAQALKASLTPAEEQRLALPATREARTYDLYLIGRHHYNRRTPDSLRTAISYFEQAIGNDPDFVAAHAGLADVYVFAGLGYAPIPPVEAFAKAKAAAARALALDETSPDALCAMALVALHGDWDVVRARALLEKSISLNSNKSAAYQFLAWCTFSTGDYVGALEPHARALELDPLNVSVIAEGGWPFHYAGLHDLALKRYQRAITLDPGFGLGHYNIAAAYHGLGQLDKAFFHYERAVECLGPSAWVLAALATAHIDTGHPSRAEEILAQLLEQSRSGIAVWLSIAMVLDALGRVDDAMEALEHSVADHEPFVWGLALEGWLRFPNARGTPRFAALLTRLGATPHDVPKQRELLLAYEASRGGLA